MLHDRPYMRTPEESSVLSPVAWILGGMLAVFVAQNVFERWFDSTWFAETFALTVAGAKSGYVWTFLTYGFLHSTATLLHLLGCALGFFFLGRQLLPQLGAKRFACLYAGSLLLGGVVWLATNFLRGGMLYGAVPGVAGLLMMFACLYPNQQMTFLLFFVVPVTLKPKYFAFAALAIDACGFLFYEILGHVSPFGWAHSANLGGMLAGFLYFRLVHDEEFRMLDRETTVELPRWLRRKAKSPDAAAEFRVNTADRHELREEVDRILDKINSQGFGALTEQEKRVLDEAKDMLSRR